MRRPQLRLIQDPGHRRRLLAGAALTVGLAVPAALVLGIGGAAAPAPSHAATASAGVATVQRRNLVATDTESGTLSYSGPQTVYDRLSGTITWLPSVGQLIRPGQALFKVDGAAVLLMDGATPAYRDLSAADSDGPDILELNRNLVRLGFNASAITVDDVWQAATTYGVDLLQESLGVPATGSLALGEVVFLPGDQLISAVDATLGSTGGGGASPAAGTGASLSLPAPAPRFVSLTSTASSTSTAAPAPTATSPATSGPPTTSSQKKRRATHHRPATATPRGTRPAPGAREAPSPRRPAAPASAASGQTLAALSALLRAESAQLRADAAALRARGGAPPGRSPSGSGRSPAASSSSAPTGSGAAGGGSASPILQTTSSTLVVTVALPATSQSEARAGEHVTVELPDNRTVGGRITAVSPVAQASSNNANANGNGSGGQGGSGGSGGSGSTVPVTVALHGLHAGAGLDQAAVSVDFVAQRARNVLSVPVTALLATAGGGYDVQAAAAPHALIPVTTGLFAAGYVQISGPGIAPGLRVTDSEG